MNGLRLTPAKLLPLIKITFFWQILAALQARNLPKIPPRLFVEIVWFLLRLMFDTSRNMDFLGTGRSTWDIAPDPATTPQWPEVVRWLQVAALCRPAGQRLLLLSHLAGHPRDVRTPREGPGPGSGGRVGVLHRGGRILSIGNGYQYHPGASQESIWRFPEMEPQIPQSSSIRRWDFPLQTSYFPPSPRTVQECRCDPQQCHGP